MAVSSVADENVEIEVVEALRALGHDVLHATESAPGDPDATLLNVAAEGGRVLVTNDKDFGDLVFR